MSDYREIIERLEKMDGPDTETDIDIWCEIFAPDAAAIDPGFRAPPYTASLDAAIALVEKMLPGWDFELTKFGSHGSVAILWPEGLRDAWARRTWSEGATPTIAVLIAFFRALESSDD